MKTQGQEYVYIVEQYSQDLILFCLWGSRKSFESIKQTFDSVTTM